MTDKFKYMRVLDYLMRLSGWLLFTILLLPQVLAIGVARPHYSDNRVAVSVDENITLPFQIQNGETTTKTVLFEVKAEPVANLKFEDQSTVARSVSRQLVLNPKTFSNQRIIFSANQSGLYKLTYSYSEAAVGSGSVKFDTRISDSFYVEVDSDSGNTLGIPLNYTGYILITSATDVRFINDLVVKSIHSDWPQIDFSGRDVDLTGFTEPVISIISNRKVAVNSSLFPALNQSAKITFYNVGSNYKIYKDGVECSTHCSVISKTSTRLIVAVTGFSIYEVIEQAVQPVQNTSSSSGSTGGSIPPRQNVTRPAQVTPTTPVQPIDSQNSGGGNQQDVNTPSTGGQAVDNPSSDIQSVLDEQQDKVRDAFNSVTKTKSKAVFVGLLIGGIIGLVMSAVLFNRKEEGDFNEE